MNLKDMLWKVMQVAETGLLDRSVREAAKEAHWTLSEIRNMLDIPPDAEPRAIIAAVYELTQGKK